MAVRFKLPSPLPLGYNSGMDEKCAICGTINFFPEGCASPMILCCGECKIVFCHRCIGIAELPERLFRRACCPQCGSPNIRSAETDFSLDAGKFDPLHP